MKCEQCNEVEAQIMVGLCSPANPWATDVCYECSKPLLEEIKSYPKAQPVIGMVTDEWTRTWKRAVNKEDTSGCPSS